MFHTEIWKIIPKLSMLSLTCSIENTFNNNDKNKKNNNINIMILLVIVRPDHF